jgi:hypothetical protein
MWNALVEMDREARARFAALTADNGSNPVGTPIKPKVPAFAGTTRKVIEPEKITL